MGKLFIITTPIGNLEDITIRALTTLFSIDILACEDTRRTGQLLTLLSEKYRAFLPSNAKKPTLISYYDQIEEKVAPALLSHIKEGTSVGLVSDAGTPLISDPGYRVVSHAINHGIPVEVIPGVSAFLTALVGSGLPLHTITFLGYLSDKEAKRKKILAACDTSSLSPVTYTCYVAPHKLKETLMSLQDVFGDIPIVLARELTKLHEDYFRGTVSLAQETFGSPKGEFVLLFTR